MSAAVGRHVTGTETCLRLIGLIRGALHKRVLLGIHIRAASRKPAVKLGSHVTRVCLIDECGDSHVTSDIALNGGGFLGWCVIR